MNKLPLSFYQNPDVCAVARELLGKELLVNSDGVTTGGIIIDTEAYAGACDRACHSYNYRRTPRNESMYRSGGTVYVYICYGIHHLFNVVTSEEGDPQGVMIRAIHPTQGIEQMLANRKKSKIDKTFTNGPGALTAALGITIAHNGLSLEGDRIYIRESGVKMGPIKVGTRIGVDYAGSDALLPYRFCSVPQ